MANGPPLEVKVWGEFACFTRPEMKAERVSYSVMTPSAARGVLEAIFWKPEFSWQVREIWVLKPILHFSIVRNEVNSKAIVSTATGWAENGGGYFAEEDRAQRHTLALRDVAYLIKADVVLASHATEDIAKYRDQFRRRVNRGQCYHRPYLGCREFSAAFSQPNGTEHSIELSDDLGRMLFDLNYVSDGDGRGTPRFFSARLEAGVLKVPHELYRKGM
jgi:CRISPR-associated protein Cas5d